MSRYFNKYLAYKGLVYANPALNYFFQIFHCNCYYNRYYLKILCYASISI